MYDKDIFEYSLLHKHLGKKVTQKGRKKKYIIFKNRTESTRLKGKTIKFLLFSQVLVGIKVD